MKYLPQNNMTVVPHPPYFSLFPRLKVKLKDCHFDTNEAIEAESQAVLSTLTDHGFQDTLRNGRSAVNGAYRLTTSRVIVASRPKVSFHQIAGPVPEIVDGSLYFIF
jgi:hypothetical protein